MHEFTVTRLDAIGRFGRSEPQGLVEGSEHRERHPFLGTELLEGHVQARRSDHHGGVQPGDREFSGPDELHDGLGRETCLLPCVKDPDATDVR